MNIVYKFLSVQSQLKLLHWQTNSYSRHIAFGKTYDDLDILFDEFVEVFQGKNPRQTISDQDIFMLKNSNEIDINEWIDDIIEFLNTTLLETLSDEDSDLLNIKDEIVAKLNKLKYLLTLK